MNQEQQEKKKRSALDYAAMARTGIKVARAGAAAAGSLPAVAVGGVIAIIVVTFVLVIAIIIGGESVVAREEPPPTPAPTIGPVPDCATVLSKLRSNFNLSVTGTNRCATLQAIWRIYSGPLSYPSFANIMKRGNPIRVDLNTSVCPINKPECIGLTNSNGIFINKDDSYFTSDTRAGKLLIHETGHVIHNRYPKLLDSYTRSYASLVKKDKGCFIKTTYGQDILKTYYFIQAPVRVVRESFAESIMLYVYNSTTGNHDNGRPADTIINFKNDCPESYSIMDRLIFNNPQYSNPIPEPL